jgi:hypothetical protein
VAHPPRYRPYRLAIITLYFIAAFSFVGTMIHAGVTGLMRERDSNVSGAFSLETVPVCVSDLHKLYGRLHELLEKQGAPAPGPVDADTMQSFEKLKAQLNAVGARCQLNLTPTPPGAEKLKVAWTRMGDLVGAAQHNAAAFGQEVGPAEREVRRAMTDLGAPID